MTKNLLSARSVTLFTITLASIIGIGIYLNPHYRERTYNTLSIYKIRAYHKLQAKVLHQPIPLKYIDDAKVRAKIAQPADWAIKQIERDFAPYKDASKANVLHTFNTLPDHVYLVLFTVKDGKVTVKRANSNMDGACESGVAIYTNVVEYLAKHGYIKDVTFLVKLIDVLPDFANIQSGELAPILATAKNSVKRLDQDTVLVPDYMSLEDIPAFEEEIFQANATYPWDKKINKIIWRGGHADVSGFRHMVVEYSKNHPDSLLDAEFISKKRNFMSLTEQIKYKYLLSIDGHTAAWTRPVWQLMSNSVLVKQKSALSQWYYAALKPDIDYIEVNNSIEELEQIPAKYSDDKLQAIALHGKEFADNNLTINDMVAYMAMVLQHYESLQNQRSN